MVNFKIRALGDEHMIGSTVDFGSSSWPSVGVVRSVLWLEVSKFIGYGCGCFIRLCRIFGTSMGTDAPMDVKQLTASFRVGM